MFKFEANEAVIIEQQKALEAALSTAPGAEKVLRKIIRKYILEAREKVVSNIRFKNGDPRRAAQSVRTSVYKRVLGGNMNIFSRRIADVSNSYEPPRHPSHRGGNRRPRDPKTQRMMDYSPLDRGMILRWQNTGTSDRAIRFKTNERRHQDKWNKHPNTGNRGSITAQHFFKSMGDRALGMISDNLARAIEEEMVALMNENNKQ